MINCLLDDEWRYWPESASAAHWEINTCSKVVNCMCCVLLPQVTRQSGEVSFSYDGVLAEFGKKLPAGGWTVNLCRLLFVAEIS